MAEEPKDAPQEVKKDLETGKEKPVVEKTEQKPIGEVIEKKEVKMVPEAALLEYKKDAKELKKEIADLKKQLEDGGSKKEVSKSLKELAEKHNVSEEFLQELVTLTKAEAEKDIDEKVDSKIKPLKEKEAQQSFDKNFEEHFGKALEALPEYKGVADMELIKTLAKTPEYASKTFEQIFEKLYPNVKVAKKTLDEAQPSKGGDKGAIDYEKAKSDPEYFKTIMADPATKKEYNDNLRKRVRL